MNRVLVVEDSRSYRNYLYDQLTQMNLKVVLARNYDDARYILESDTDFLCAVLDYNLPDAPSGEVIDLALECGLKVIVITGYFSEGMREEMFEKGVVDYILKDSMASVSYILPLVTRLSRNRQHKALIVDDSPTVRNHLSQLLEHHYISSLQAENGNQAIEILEANPDITLLITDNNMPEKDGITLTRELRQYYDRGKLAILGISTSGSETVTARFLKAGANDFLKKPFNQEEFYCRVQNLLDMKDITDDMFRMANQDSLTGLWNRRYLFSNADCLKEQCNVAMMDIDFFKKINDTYGHEGGDQALVTVSHIISIYFKDDLTARIGGEEFCIVNYGDYNAFVRRLENMRARIEKTPVPFNEDKISLTISIGCTRAEGNLDTSMGIADNRLYQAKNSGRNRVISS